MSRLVVPPNRDLTVLAPKVQRAVTAILAGMTQAGFRAVQFDTMRTADRQAFLYGKGRTVEQCQSAGLDSAWAWPDCPDGVVTKAASHLSSWHGFSCAVDIVENDNSPWNASQAFWNTLGKLARANGLTWGGDWKMLDLPHCQAKSVPVSPTPTDRLLLQTAGMQAVWAKYGLL